MKKSNIITVAICAFLLVAGGGVGAYAADQINGDAVAENSLDGSEIQNESVTGADIDNGTLTGSDIRNQTLTTADLAAGSVNDALIQNGAVDSGEVQDGSLTGVDIKDGAVQWNDLASGVEDSLVANIKAGDQLDSNGKREVQWVDQWGTYVQVPTGDVLVSLNVISHSTQPVKVLLSDTALFCIAIPVEGLGSQCSAVIQIPNGALSEVQVVGATVDEVDVEVNGVRLGG